jgi:uncharacterized membrane protein YbhN (UPF0104 family)
MSTRALAPQRRPAGFAWSFWLRVVAGVGLLSLVARTLDLGEVGRLIREVRWGWAALLSALALARPVLMAWKWSRLLVARGVPLGLGEAVRAYWTGYLLGFVTPGGLGAEVYRVWALRGAAPVALVAASVVLERVLGLIVLVAVGLATLPFAAATLGAAVVPVGWTLAVLALAGALLLGLSFRAGLLAAATARFPWIARMPGLGKLEAFHEAWLGYRGQTAVLVRFLAWTVVELGVLILIAVTAVRAVDLAVPAPYLAGVLPVIYLMLRLPISFQGLGVQEGLLVWILLRAGASAEAGLAVSLLLRISEILFVLVPGLAFWWAGGKLRPREAAK